MSRTVRSEFEMACPKCGSDEHLRVSIQCWASLHTHGTDPYGDHDWDDTRACHCASCSFAGTVAEFRVLKDAPPPLLKTFHVSFWEYERFHATVQAVDDDHALTLGETLLSDAGPDAFEIVESFREDFGVEEARP